MRRILNQKRKGGGIIPLFDLDNFPSAESAFSTKKIRTTYIGNCMKVRRASDNTTLDIGFTDSDLDTSSLQTFCAGTDGFVEIWYDQSGNNTNANQTVLVSQPKIVASGAVILKDNIPAISSDGIDDYMVVQNSSDIFAPEFSVFSVFAYKIKVAEQRFYAYNNSSGTSKNYFLLRATNSDLNFLGTQGNPSFGTISVSSTNNQDFKRYVFSHLGKANDKLKGKIDTLSEVSADINNFDGVSANPDAFILFQGRSAQSQVSIPSETLAQQFVFYNSYLTTDLQNIEDSIKLTFNI
jgi:hypothetical protein